MDLTIIFSNGNYVQCTTQADLEAYLQECRLINSIKTLGCVVTMEADEFVITHRFRLRSDMKDKPELDHVRLRTNKRHVFLWPNGDVFSSQVIGRTDAVLRDVVLTSEETSFCVAKCLEMAIPFPPFVLVEGHLSRGKDWLYEAP